MNYRENDPLIAATLRNALDYDPETGVFIWRHRTDASRAWNARWAGKKAGCSNNSNRDRSGHIKIRVNKLNYLAHRLAWLWMTGEWPAVEIDHKDRDGSNNRWKNLRAASRRENTYNSGIRSDNSTGFKGVYWHKKERYWYIRIQADGKQRQVSNIATAEAAHALRASLAAALHGEFSSENCPLSGDVSLSGEHAPQLRGYPRMRGRRRRNS